MAKKLPAYNASSLADIAFMLLIFFLVTTTMDTDKGLRRQLPQMPPEEQDTNTPPINERNVFVVLVDKNDRLLVEGELTRVEDLKEKTKEFLTNPYNSKDLPEMSVEEIPYFGMVEVASKAIISLRNDEGTTYGTYIAVQNALAAAINELREDAAQEKFNKSFVDCNKDQQKALKTLYKQKISEAEPKRTGGR